MAKKRPTSLKSKRAASNDWLSEKLFDPYAYLIANSPEIVVTPETALRFSAVFGCVRIITESLSSVPLITYRRRKDGGKERALRNPVHNLLKYRPNRWMTSFQFREYLTGHALLRGNGYAEIVWDERGRPAELLIRHPTRVRPDVDPQTGDIIYRYRPPHSTTEVIIPKYRMFHLMAYTDNGLTGCSPIELMRSAVQLGMSAEQHGVNLFNNAASPAGILEYAGKLTPTAKERLKEDWEKIYKGPKKAGQVAVLEAGLSWKSVGMPAKDAQYIEGRRLQVEEIARIYRVPLYKLQDHTHSTFSNVEHLSIEFVTDCLLPWAKRWEETIARDLLYPGESLSDIDDEYFSEFLFQGLLRGDVKSRTDALATQRQNGIISANEWRALENMNPIGPEGDKYLVQVNMTTVEKLGEEEGEQDQQSEEDNERDRAFMLRESFRPTIQSIWDRIVRKEQKAISSAAKNKRDGFVAWFDKFCDEQWEFASECLQATFRTLQESLAVLAGEDWTDDIQDDIESQFRSLLSEYHASLIVRTRDRSKDFTSLNELEVPGPEELSDYWTRRTLEYSGGRYDPET